MKRQYPLKGLAPRDVVSRSICDEIARQQTPYVYLNATQLEAAAWEHHFPGIFELCQSAGMDPRQECIPVIPAAHYSCGGIATSVKGETAVEGLYVIGESACTGLHGANQLVSNSLLEASLMATALASAMARQEFTEATFAAPPEKVVVHDTTLDETAGRLMDEIRQIVQKGCGIVKTRKGLRKASLQLQVLEITAERSLPENNLQLHQLKMVLNTTIMLTKSCREQTENKGVYCNKDWKKEAVEAFS